jgi:hypothetical protein
MRRFWGLGVLVILALLLTGVGQAKADYFFDFTFTGDSVSGSGELTATSNGDGTYTAVIGFATITASIGIITNGDSLVLVANPNAPSATTTAVFSVAGLGSFTCTYDDQLSPASNPLITNAGLLFSTSDLNTPYVNIYSYAASTYAVFPYASGTYDTPVNFTLSAAVPEPATLFIYGLGLVALAAFRMRSRKA